MRKFIVLLQKEIKELLTLQVIAPLIVSVLMLVFIGNTISKQQEKTKASQDIYVVDQDKTETSQRLVAAMQSKTLNLVKYDGTITEAVADAPKSGKGAVVLIPENYERSLRGSAPQKITLYTFIKNFSILGNQTYANLLQSVAIANNQIGAFLINQTPAGNISAATLQNPVQTNEIVSVNGKQASTSLSVVMNFVMQQTTFIPIVLFIVIMLSSQMIATAIASEKENKTLETLLTTPVSRNAIVVSKMVGAGLISLLASVFYMYGYRSYMGGLMGGNSGGDVSSAVKALGLTMTTQSYILLGTSLFVGILVALAIALILGAFAEDIKSVAGLISPLMLLIAIPYLLTFFADTNTLPTALKYIVYAIPFSHVFLAAPNLFLHNYGAVIWGIIYQLIWFTVFVLIAARIFSSDKIMTMKLNFGKKKGLLKIG